MRTSLPLAALTALLLLVAGLPAPGLLAQPFVPPPLIVEVTGNPAPAAFVGRAVERAVRWTLPDRSQPVVIPPVQADLIAGADLRLEARVGTPDPARQSPVQVLPVMVRNVPAPCYDPEVLFVSNSPETLRWSKGLFRGSLAQGDGVRLLYHHRNGAEGQRMVLTVQVANPSREPARLWVSDAVAGPATDELFTGHAAAARWLRQYWSCTAQALTVPPNSSRTLAGVVLPPQHVGSGVLQVVLEEGEKLVLDVQGWLEDGLEPAQESYGINRDTRHMRGTFPSTQREIALNHAAGGISMVNIGGVDLVEETSSGRPLRGNYGVVYQVRGVIASSEATARQVAVRVIAVGGSARGTFLVNGATIETPLLSPRSPVTLTTITLAPYERRAFSLATMPQAGSAYPLRLILSPP